MTTSSQLARLVAGIAGILAAATTVVPVALAGGEPKNESPFTRLVVAGRGLSESVGPSHAGATLAISGELKNQAPFTVRAYHAGAALVGIGEPKNQPPFTRR